MSFSYTQSAIIAGKSIEIRVRSLPVVPTRSRVRVGRRSCASDENKALNRDKTLSRSRRSLCNLVNANHDCDKFLTLTFGDNIDDLDIAHNYFRLFVRKMSRRYPSFKYIAVPEFQKRGAVHYHIVCNLPYVKSKQLSRIWGKGFIRINKIDHIDNVGVYISKYLSKDNCDVRLTERRCYYHSRNILLPTKITDDVQISLLKNYIGNSDVQRVHTYSYDDEYYGKTEVTSILMKNPVDLSRVLFLTPLPYLRPSRQWSDISQRRRHTGAVSCVQKTGFDDLERVAERLATLSAFNGRRLSV